MEYPICQKCGAAIGDKRLHDRWHTDLERELKNKIAEVMKEIDRQVARARLGRPR
ncbi:hypothetical protein ACWCHM_26295 [Micromonospora sp. SCSIO 07396]